jgi:hypothetical protein
MMWRRRIRKKVWRRRRRIEHFSNSAGQHFSFFNRREHRDIRYSFAPFLRRRIGKM